MNKATLTLTLCAAALAFAGTATAAGPLEINPDASKKVVKKPAAKNANQQLLAQRVTASKLWLTLSKSMARVSGKITVDEAVLPYITGGCEDVVVKAYPATSYDEIASMSASGDISTGTCTYTMFLKPGNDMRLLSFYEGTRAPNHPGDYLEVNSVGSVAFTAAAGGSYTHDFYLTYDWIK